MESTPLAVVDIGSNSVRMVVYDGLKRVPMPLFNEKVLCGLGKDISKTGTLNKEGVKSAEETLRRFIKLSKVLKASSLDMFATAAVRDAKDGQAFIDKIYKKYGGKISTFSGEEEAYYAAMGIISSVAKAKGVVGDLGGGSLELLGIDKNTTSGKGVSLPIGPLRINNLKKTPPQKLSEFISSHMKKYPLVKELSGKSFYAVGGAFRNIAKIHMTRTNYPLKVIHNYDVDASDLLDTIKIVTRMPESALIKVPGITKKRLEFLPYAALILESIITIGKPKNVVFVASGIREGFLYSKLNDKLKAQDPLIAGCTDIMSRILPQDTYGQELHDWMSPLFENETTHEKRLRLAACIMSEISCFENTEYKAELAYRMVLDSSLTGLDHRDRVFIAKSLYCRYSNEPDEHILMSMQSLLNSKSLQSAHVIGSAMRLGRSLSCSHSGILKHTPLQIVKNKLVLKLSPDNSDLDGEAIRKRSSQLAEILGLDCKIV